MRQLVFVIDSSHSLLHVAEEALSPSGVEVLGIPDIAAARRKLLEAMPALVIAPMGIGADSEAGLKFCRELHAHPSYTQVPVILYSPAVTEESIRHAIDAGAKGLVPIPIIASVLRHRVESSVPALKPQIPAAVPVQKVTPKVPKPTPAAPQPAVQPPLEPDMAEKMKVAQLLLAKVLHNLKTSDLLRLAETEDVPRIVYEMTRSVCGVQQGGEKPTSQRGEESSVLAGLDDAFKK